MNNEPAVWVQGKVIWKFMSKNTAQGLKQVRAWSSWKYTSAYGKYKKDWLFIICYRCQTLLIVGDDSPHLDETVELNGKLDPEKTDFLKVIFIALMNRV